MFGGTTVVRREPIGVIGGIVPGNFPQGCPQACLTSSRPVAARTRSPSAPHAAAIPTAPRGPQRAEAPGRLPHPGQHGTAPTPQGRCDRSPPHGQDRRPPLTATVPPAAPDRLCRTLLPDSSLTSRAASSPHRCPEPITPTANARATRARSPRLATVTLSRIFGPAIIAPRLPRPPAPAHHRGRQAMYTGMRARLSCSRQAGTRYRRGPFVAVRGKPTVHTDRSGGPDARPLYVRGHRDTPVYSATR
jgi:hypothetical protein